MICQISIHVNVHVLQLHCTIFLFVLYMYIYVYRKCLHTGYMYVGTFTLYMKCVIEAFYLHVHVHDMYRVRTL